ncbi:WecB/TagA/CpsF family glycosyltransferase [Novosphingobium colocasiae]
MFHTGTVKRAPLWMREARLEWAYRLAREPRRLWRRYLIQAPKFVFMVARSALWRRLAMAPKPGDSCK